MVNRREKYRVGLHPIYAKRYDTLCSLLDDKWQPCQGLRTIEEQDKLRQRKIQVTRAGGGDSAHNYGCATDWAIFDANGKPSWPDQSDPIWKEYAEACKKAGLRWGGAFSDYPHNQLPLSVKYKFIGQCLRDKDLAYALQMLQECIINA